MTVGMVPSKAGGACVPLSGMGVLAACQQTTAFLRQTRS